MASTANDKCVWHGTSTYDGESFMHEGRVTMGYNFNRLSAHTKQMLGKTTGNKRLETKGMTEHALADMHNKAKQTINTIESRLDS